VGGGGKKLVPELKGVSPRDGQANPTGVTLLRNKGAMPWKRVRLSRRTKPAWGIGLGEKARPRVLVL